MNHTLRRSAMLIIAMSLLLSFVLPALGASTAYAASSETSDRLKSIVGFLQATTPTGPAYRIVKESHKIIVDICENESDCREVTAKFGKELFSGAVGGLVTTFVDPSNVDSIKYSFFQTHGRTVGETASAGLGKLRKVAKFGAKLGPWVTGAVGAIETVQHIRAGDWEEATKTAVGTGLKIGVALGVSALAGTACTAATFGAGAPFCVAGAVFIGGTIGSMAADWAGDVVGGILYSRGKQFVEDTKAEVESCVDRTEGFKEEFCTVLPLARTAFLPVYPAYRIVKKSNKIIVDICGNESDCREVTAKFGKELFSGAVGGLVTTFVDPSNVDSIKYSFFQTHGRTVGKAASVGLEKLRKVAKFGAKLGPWVIWAVGAVKMVQHIRAGDWKELTKTGLGTALIAAVMKFKVGTVFAAKCTLYTAGAGVKFCVAGGIVIGALAVLGADKVGDVAGGFLYRRGEQFVENTRIVGGYLGRKGKQFVENKKAEVESCVGRTEGFKEKFCTILPFFGPVAQIASGGIIPSGLVTGVDNRLFGGGDNDASAGASAGGVLIHESIQVGGIEPREGAHGGLASEFPPAEHERLEDSRPCGRRRLDRSPFGRHYGYPDRRGGRWLRRGRRYLRHKNRRFCSQSGRQTRDQPHEEL